MSVASEPIVCYAQDSRISGGSIGFDESELIVRALQHSRHTEVPLVAFLESAGARLQEGTGALAGSAGLLPETSRFPVVLRDCR